MKVLLVSTSDKTGGAAVAASRLMQALQKQGVQVKMLVRDKQGDNPDVVPLNVNRWKKAANWLRFAWERWVIFACNRFSKKNLFQVSIANTGTDISKHLLVREADIVHLHWVNQGMLSLQDIRRLLSLGKPVVWTLHDMWASTGICHYAGGCKRYFSECKDCPMQVRHPFVDLSVRIFREKSRVGFGKICFVGCSNWIASVCKGSALLRNAKFTSIPNPIDVSVFHPYPEAECRKGFPQDKKLVLFAAAKVSEVRKGAMYLVEACRLIANTRKDIEVLLMGNCSEELRSVLPVPSHSLGYLSSPEEIAKAYSAADVFVTPSLEDNLPNTIMESLACGTPCVGFRTGGIPEMIGHKVTGYVADYASAEDLAQGICWVLDYPDKELLSVACLKKVETEYAEGVVARKYMETYHRLSSGYFKG